MHAQRRANTFYLNRNKVKSKIRGGRDNVTRQQNYSRSRKMVNETLNNAWSAAASKVAAMEAAEAAAAAAPSATQTAASKRWLSVSAANNSRRLGGFLGGRFGAGVSGRFGAGVSGRFGVSGGPAFGEVCGEVGSRRERGGTGGTGALLGVRNEPKNCPREEGDAGENGLRGGELGENGLRGGEDAMDFKLGELGSIFSGDLARA